MSAINEAIDELTKLRQEDARRHSAEVLDLMREKAATVLANEEQVEYITRLEANVYLFRKGLSSLKADLDNERASGIVNRKIAELFRAHLDDGASDLEHDNEWEQEVRSMTWNEEDVKAARIDTNTDIDLTPWPKAIKEM